MRHEFSFGGLEMKWTLWSRGREIKVADSNPPQGYR